MVCGATFGLHKHMHTKICKYNTLSYWKKLSANFLSIYSSLSCESYCPFRIILLSLYSTKENIVLGINKILLWLKKKSKIAFKKFTSVLCAVYLTLKYRIKKAYIPSTTMWTLILLLHKFLCFKNLNISKRCPYSHSQFLNNSNFFLYL